MRDASNVIFIVLDTTRKDRLSPYNDDIDFTPHLDAFANDSIVYEDAVAQAPWTLPSHASMFTGKYPWEHGATQQNLYLDTEQELLAERFRDAGYRTACYTSNVWISPYTSMARGFQDIDNFFPFLPTSLLPKTATRLWRRANQGHGQRIAAKLTQWGDKLHIRAERKGNTSKTAQTFKKSKRFIQQSQNRDTPFFLFLNLMDAHEPYFPPEIYRKHHAEDVDPSTVCQEPGKYYAGKEDADFDAINKLYNASIDHLDDQLGEFFTYMKENGLLEDTAVVICGDHGQDLGEEARYGHQFTVSDQTVAVPLITRTPDGESGPRSELVELRELYSLIPSLAGLDDPYSPGTNIASGGYAYPRLDISRIPKDRREPYAKTLRFVRGTRKKLVKTIGDETAYQMIDLDTGEELPVDNTFQERIDNIGTTEEGTMLEDADEQVKQRLEQLGYM